MYVEQPTVLHTKKCASYTCTKLKKTRRSYHLELKHLVVHSTDPYIQHISNIPIDTYIDMVISMLITHDMVPYKNDFNRELTSYLAC